MVGARAVGCLRVAPHFPVYDRRSFQPSGAGGITERSDRDPAQRTSSGLQIRTARPSGTLLQNHLAPPSLDGAPAPTRSSPVSRARCGRGRRLGTPAEGAGVCRSGEPAELRGIDHLRPRGSRSQDRHASGYARRSPAAGNSRRRGTPPRSQAGGLHAPQAGGRGDHQFRSRRTATRGRPRAGRTAVVCDRPARPHERGPDPRDQRRRTGKSAGPSPLWRGEEIHGAGGGRAHPGNPGKTPPGHRSGRGHGSGPACASEVAAQVEFRAGDGARRREKSGNPPDACPSRPQSASAQAGRRRHAGPRQPPAWPVPASGLVGNRRSAQRRPPAGWRPDPQRPRCRPRQRPTAALSPTGL